MDNPRRWLAGSQLGDSRHVCAFFNSDEEEYRVLLPFIRDGFSCGHKAIHVVDAAQHRDHRQRLASAGIDAIAAEQCGDLELLTTAETYLQDGQFDPDRMLKTFSTMAESTSHEPHRTSRIVCRMDWASDTRVLTDKVIEFESRVNDLWDRHDHVVICTYRVDRFRGDAIIDILRTHPAVILGGSLRRNPFYVPSQKFVEALRTQTTRPAADDGESGATSA